MPRNVLNVLYYYRIIGISLTYNIGNSSPQLGLLGRIDPGPRFGRILSGVGGVKTWASGGADAGLGDILPPTALGP